MDFRYISDHQKRIVGLGENKDGKADTTAYREGRGSQGTPLKPSQIHTTL